MFFWSLLLHVPLLLEDQFEKLTLCPRKGPRYFCVYTCCSALPSPAVRWPAALAFTLLWKTCLPMNSQHWSWGSRTEQHKELGFPEGNLLSAVTRWCKAFSSLGRACWIFRDVNCTENSFESYVQCSDQKLTYGTESSLLQRFMNEVAYLKVVARHTVGWCDTANGSCSGAAHGSCLQLTGCLVSNCTCCAALLKQTNTSCWRISFRRICYDHIPMGADQWFTLVKFILFLQI